MPVSKPLLLALFALSALPGSLQARNVSNEELARLDIRFQDFSRDFYQDAIRSNLFTLAKHNSLTELKSGIEQLIKAGNTTQAISLLHYNFKLIRRNIDAVETIALTELLLEHNDWHGARRIFDTAQVEAGKIAVSNLSYTFAKYFLARKDWQKSLQHLQGVINDLSEEDANYARIMVGTILQHQKQHRKAITYYQNVSKNSRYYPNAVLNIAIAYIRQDWWTDAYILINDLIKEHPEAVNAQMIDRLNLVLGYALLRKQYFRNSRDAFRNVGLKGPYTNRALLGIALTAANQEDFIGALNAITLLKEQKTTDLAVDEAYLLLPYTYGKLKQNLTATSAYNDAIKYYQHRIAVLQGLSGTDENILTNISFSENKTEIRINKNDFDYSRHYPDSFFKNYRYLTQFGKNGFNNNKIQASYAGLLIDYKKALASISSRLINERLDYLQSYLNQARYGLARLYDSTLVSNK